MTAQPAKTTPGLPQAGRDPAHEHAAVAPAAHVVHEVADEPVEILDRVRAPQRAVERAGDPEALEGHGLLQPFPQGRRGTRMSLFEAGRELTTADMLKACSETVPLSVIVEDKIVELREWGQLRTRRASSGDMVIETRSEIADRLARISGDN